MERMTSLERAMATIQHRIPDRVPVDLHNFLVTVAYAGFPMAQALQDGEMLAEAQIRFWRDPDGPEVDWVIEKGETFIPIEVKYSQEPTSRDIRHLQTFIDEYVQASRGYVVCQTPRRFKLGPQIDAIPWQDLPSLVG